MEQTIYDILTDETTRGPEAIAQSLEASADVGAPWFDWATSLQNE